MRSARKGFYAICCGRRKRILLQLLLLAVLVCWILSRITSDDQHSWTPDQDLEHYRRSRSLKHYLDNVQLLIEPSASCGHLEEVPVVILVSSTPTGFEQREAIRRTWAKYQPTYFVMGLDGPKGDEQLINNYIEAKQYSDMVLFDFQEHQQNCTLKTALMMQWVLDRCPLAQFLFKTDDDVVVNPWILKQVLKDNEDAKLVGYIVNNTEPTREQYNKRYLPRWLYSEEEVPQYLSGSGYLISGEYLKKILRAGYEVPMINTDDIYFTYLVAKKSLGYSLTHDSRLTPYRPWPSWFPFSCAYWVQAAVQNLDVLEVIRIWSKIEDVGKDFVSDKYVCDFYNRYLSIFVYLY